MRLISICPSNTELLAYLDLTTHLVGVDDFSDWPSSILELPRLGPDLSIRMDDVESLKPDLVLASLSVPGMEKNVEELKKRGIPHVVYNPNSLSDIKDNLIDLGKRTNKEAKAAKVVEKFEMILQEYTQKAQEVSKPRLYWEWWPNLSLPQEEKTGLLKLAALLVEKMRLNTLIRLAFNLTGMKSTRNNRIIFV